MKKILICLVSFLIIAFFQVANVLYAQEGMDGTTLPSITQDIEVQVEPWKTFSGQVDFVANGVALRNRAQGVIHLRGIPEGAKVINAYVWWGIQTNNAVGSPPGSSIYFNGNKIFGAKTCSTLDPCWGNTSFSAYRGRVTNFVPATEPNGDYLVTIRNPAAVNTTGDDPWPTPVEKRKFEGATMVVVYSYDGLPNRWVSLYDIGVCSMFSGSYTATLSHPASSGTNVLFGAWGADGQRGSSHSDSAARETTSFNTVQIAGAGAPAPRTTASDWNGSDGFPLPQLWDTHVHNVSGLVRSPTSSTVDYVAGGDCLVPVGFALSSD